MTLASFQSQLSLSGFAGQVSNAQVPQSAVTQHKAAVLASAALTGVPTAPTAAPGTNNSQVASTAFVQAAAGMSASLGSPGYVRFANGLTIQWGQTASIAGDGNGTTFFATTFSSVLAIAVTARSGQADFQTNNTVTSLGTSSFTLNHRGNTAAFFDYIVVGYIS